MNIETNFSNNIDEIDVGYLIICEYNNIRYYFIIFDGYYEEGKVYLVNLKSNCIIRKFECIEELKKYLKDYYIIRNVKSPDDLVLKIKE